MVVVKTEFVCKLLRQSLASQLSLFIAYQFLIFSVVAYQLEKRKKMSEPIMLKLSSRGLSLENSFFLNLNPMLFLLEALLFSPVHTERYPCTGVFKTENGYFFLIHHTIRFLELV